MRPGMYILSDLQGRLSAKSLKGKLLTIRLWSSCGLLLIRSFYWKIIRLQLLTMVEVSGWYSGRRQAVRLWNRLYRPHAGGKFGGGATRSVESCTVALPLNAPSTSWMSAFIKTARLPRIPRSVVADEIIGETDFTGTTVHFTTWIQRFTETVEFDFEKLSKRVEPFLSSIVAPCISITDKRDGMGVSRLPLSESGLGPCTIHQMKIRDVIFETPIYTDCEMDDTWLK